MIVLESPYGNDGPTKMFEEHKSCSNIVDALTHQNYMLDERYRFLKKAFQILYLFYYGSHPILLA